MIKTDMNEFSIPNPKPLNKNKIYYDLVLFYNELEN